MKLIIELDDLRADVPSLIEMIMRIGNVGAADIVKYFGGTLNDEPETTKPIGDYFSKDEMASGTVPPPPVDVVNAPLVPSAPASVVVAPPPTALAAQAAISPPPANVANIPAPPAAPVAPPPSATPGNLADVEVDSEGYPWDARIHASTQTKNADGRWKKKKGASEEETESVRSELRKLHDIKGAPLPGSAPVAIDTPAKPAEAATPFSTWLRSVVTPNLQTEENPAGKITQARLKQFVEHLVPGSDGNVMVLNDANYYQLLPTLTTWIESDLNA